MLITGMVTSMRVKKKQISRLNKQMLNPYYGFKKNYYVDNYIYKTNNVNMSQNSLNAGCSIWKYLHF